MEIFRFKQKALKEYSIVCEYWETSRAWGHRAILMFNNNEVLETKVRYYNRTWEMYRYQSCMQKLLSLYHEEKLNDYIECYKYDNEVERFKKGEKDSVIRAFEKDSIAKRIRMMRDAINNKDFSRD
jgi:hypothetical protein